MTIHTTDPDRAAAAARRIEVEQAAVDRQAELEAKHALHLEAVPSRPRAGQPIGHQRVVLKASAVITSDGKLPTTVILVALAGNYTTPFVVWYASYQPDSKSWSYSAGLYEYNLRGGLEAFTERARDFDRRAHSLAYTP